jgi:excisionase family DNA binding protein
MSNDDSTALYVRLPSEQAGRLDRASLATGLPKRQLISGLVRRYVDPDSPRSMEALQRMGARSRPRRVTVDVDDNSELVIGHASLSEREPATAPPASEVLTLEQAAALLQVDEQLVRELAESGELPGRRLGDQWRFSRQALIDWLGEPAR